MHLVERAGREGVEFVSCAQRMRCAAWRVHGRLRNEHGWTLMEVMVVTSIIAILSAIAIPRFSQLSLQMRTSAAAGDLANDLQYARVMSQRTGVPYYVNVESASPMKYTVRRSKFPPAVNATVDVPPVRNIDLTTRMPGVVFTQNGTTTDCFGGAAGAATPSTPMSFNSRGLPSTAASYFVGSNDGANAYVVSVTGAGRARLCHRVGGGWR